MKNFASLNNLALGGWKIYWFLPTGTWENWTFIYVGIRAHWKKRSKSLESMSRPDFLERHIKKKSYQPFWCWNFLITHEFGQTFSSFALKIGWSIKSWGYQTENDIFLDNVAFIWIKLSMSTLKGMETLKTPVNKSHLSSSNTSGP